jgi:TctA family transporter
MRHDDTEIRDPIAIGIAFLGPKIASVALLFGPVEKAALLFLGFVLILGIGEGSKKKGLAMIGLGLLLGTVGVDLVSGEERFVFDVSPLRDGFGIAVVAMGLFGISEVLLMAEGNDEAGEVLNYRQSLRDLLPNRTETMESIGPVMRAAFSDSFSGCCPAAAR